MTQSLVPGSWMPEEPVEECEPGKMSSNLVPTLGSTHPKGKRDENMFSKIIHAHFLTEFSDFVVEERLFWFEFLSFF